MLKEYTIPSQNQNGEYSVLLFFDKSGNLLPDKCSCDCKHGSFYRYTQKNVDAGRWTCAHIKQAIKKHENNEMDNIEMERRKNEKRQIKEIEPIF